MLDCGAPTRRSKKIRGMKRSILFAILFTAIFVIVAPAALAQTTDSGQDVYTATCARCHGADGLGVPNKYPPLAGNPDASDHDFVVDVVTNGLSGKEILGVTYTRDMPAFGNRLSADEIQQVSAYVVELSVSGPPQTTPTTAPVGEGTASVGEDIFAGSTLLSNGGPACAACHSAGVYDRLGGPGMAIDLNGIIDDFGKAGFIDAITDPVVDPMIAVFADRQITEQEANDLAAYLETTKAGQPASSSIDLLVVLGFSGFLLLILVTALVIRGPQNAYVEKLRSTR